MAIKKRGSREAEPEHPAEDPELDRRVDAFGHGAYSPVGTPEPTAADEQLDLEAAIGRQGILFRYNDYQRKLLKDSAVADRRRIQKLLESIVWPELERRKSTHAN